MIGCANAVSLLCGIYHGKTSFDRILICVWVLQFKAGPLLHWRRMIMNWMVRFLRSSLGSKYLMAVTGLGIYLFFIAHIAGNLSLFFGQDAMNSYALGLKSIPFGGLWIARVGLLVIFAVHIATAIKLTSANKQARPVQYSKPSTIQASLASRLMPQTGVVILAFLIFHLAHFTWRVVAYNGPYTDAQGRDDVYSMVVAGFQQPALAILYMITTVLVGLHLSHGAKSMFQTIGLRKGKYTAALDMFPPALGWFVAVAGLSIPLAVLLGIIR